MTKEFNSQRIFWVLLYGRRFIVLEHQYGRRNVMWKCSIVQQNPPTYRFLLVDCNQNELRQKIETCEKKKKTDKKVSHMSYLIFYLRWVLLFFCFNYIGIRDHTQKQIRHQTSDIRHPTSKIRHRTSDFGNRKSDIGHRTSKIRHQDVGHRTS